MNIYEYIAVSEKEKPLDRVVDDGGMCAIFRSIACVGDSLSSGEFESENGNSEIHCDRVLTGDALLELNYGQEVWLRLVKGTIPAKFPPATTFSGYLLYRT